nr:hypothetical protein [Tanacetum cinerariifolium]
PGPQLRSHAGPDGQCHAEQQHQRAAGLYAVVELDQELRAQHAQYAPEHQLFQPKYAPTPELDSRAGHLDSVRCIAPALPRPEQLLQPELRAVERLDWQEDFPRPAR